MQKYHPADSHTDIQDVLVVSAQTDMIQMMRILSCD